MTAAPMGDVDASLAQLDRDNDGVAAAAGSAAEFFDKDACLMSGIPYM